MAHKIDSASGSITLISEDGSGNVNLTLPRAGLGTAASADTGTAAGNIPVLDGSGQIASGVLTNAAVADNAITLAKMAHGTDGELITYDATGAPANVAVGTSGQVLTSGGVGVAPTFQTSTHTPDDNSVTLAKMASGTDGNLITYDASGDPAYVTTGTSGQVLTSGGTGVAPTFQTAAGGGGASAWCNFNGQGTVSIRDSDNVSSVTDNGTGDYTLNYSSAYANANYSFNGISDNCCPPNNGDDYTGISIKYGGMATGSTNFRVLRLRFDQQSFSDPYTACITVHN